MQNFSEVGLGFAEFVSQLLQETFEATLAAQNHQIEKYRELENALALPTERYRELYVDDESLESLEREIFGVQLREGMLLNPQLIAALREVLETEGENPFSKKLRAADISTVREQLAIQLVAEQKARLEQLLNHSEMARLVVDSGEIRAKLELSNIVQISQDSSEPSAKAPRAAALRAGESRSSRIRVPPENPKKPRKSAGKTPLASPAKLLAEKVDIDGVNMRRIVDDETNRSTLIVDRKSLSSAGAARTLSPSLRIAARPAAVNSSSELYSEVTIKFKTV